MIIRASLQKNKQMLTCESAGTPPKPNKSKYSEHTVASF